MYTNLIPSDLICHSYLVTQQIDNVFQQYQHTIRLHKD